MLCAAMALLTVGCEHVEPLVVEPPPEETGPSFQFIQETIFDTSCALAGCHAGANPPQGMSLSAGVAYANIVNVPSNEQPGVLRIAPGDPASSYLFQKITGAPSISGAVMPLGRPPLSDEQINTIREWIEEGAEDN